MNRVRAYLWAFAVSMLGIVGYFGVIGPRALYPTNIAWLGSGDPAQHFLGWSFFRQTGWDWPLGSNPDYGLEISNALLYSDSLPLFAFPFKLLTDWLPDPFQYFGWWLLVCFVLQAWFATKLIGIVTDARWVQWLGAGLFVFSAPMIGRMAGHMSLSGHFLILAALYLALRPRTRYEGVAWGVLLMVAAMVHAYLLAIAIAIWLTAIATDVSRNELSPKYAIGRMALTTLAVTAVCWQVGYFSVSASGVATGEFGFYRMNLLSVIDPSSWSYLLGDIPEGGGDYEGFNYLGLGVILLLGITFVRGVGTDMGIGRLLSRHRLFVVLMMAFSLYALSNNVGFGAYSLEVPIPDLLVKATSVFRASGRMFWPVFYTIVLFAIWLALRVWGTRGAVIALAFLLPVQVLDTSAGWKPIRDSRMVEPSSRWETPMDHPLWDQAADEYSEVRYVPVGNHVKNWRAISAYAAQHGLATDAVYLARVDADQLEFAREQAKAAVRNNRYRSDALYILNNAQFDVAREQAQTSDHLAITIDGMNIVAPDWGPCTVCED